MLQAHHSAVAAFVEQELGHALFNAFHDFFASVLGQIVLLQGADILLQLGRSVFLQRKGVSADAVLNSFFHRLFL